MKIIQTIFVFICLLFFTGIVALITLLNGLMHYKGLLLVVPISLFLLFTCLIFEWFTTKQRKAWFAGIMGVALVSASIAPIQYHYKMNIPTVDAEIDVFAYEPFAAQNKVVKSKASLQLQEPLPRIDGATAMYPLYAAFVEATYPKKKVIRPMKVK